jgi:hypothetical protein
MRLDPVLRGAWLGAAPGESRRPMTAADQLQLFDATVRAGARVLKRVWLGSEGRSK